MGLRRLLALAVAIALVVGAFVVRSHIDHKNGSASPASSGNTADTNSAPSGPGTTPKPTVPTAITLVCIPELARVCQSAAAANSNVTATTAGPADTLSKLAAADDPSTIASAWVTLAPWPDLVDGQRARAAAPKPSAFAATTEIGRSPVGIAVRATRADALTRACGGTISWRCIGDKAGSSWSDLGGQPTWGTLTPAHANPTTSATGLTTLAAAITQYRGNSDYVSVDLESDDAFQKWVQRLEKAIPRSAFDDAKGTPLQQFLLQPVADVVAVTEVEVATDAANRASTIATTYPAPTVVASAVVATAAGVALPPSLIDSLTKAATKTGWKVPASDATGLPSSTTMEALQIAWKNNWR